MNAIHTGPVARLPDGRWLMTSGEKDSQRGLATFVSRRFDAAGRPDLSFGQSGPAQTAQLYWPESGLVGAPSGVPWAIAGQSDGNIVGGEG